MAFSKAPSQSTYQTKSVKLIQALDNRDAAATKDIIALNGFYDIVRDQATQTQKFHWVKRDGLVAFPFVPTDSVRGIHNWEAQDKILIAHGTKIAIVTASTGALVTEVTPFITTTGDVGFVEFQYASGEVKVVACDGSRVITIDTANVVVTGSDVDMPTPIQPHPVYLDGYLFLIKSGTSDIYNSNLDNPLVYTSGDFISAEQDPDSLVRLARSKNYIVALGKESIEFFYDAANATGSPLNRNDTFLKQVGYLAGLSERESKLFFIGKTATTSPTVYAIEDSKLSEIGSASLRRYLQPETQFNGSLISFGGRDFYTIHCGSISYMMDYETSVLTRLAFGSGSTMPITNATQIVRSGVGNTTIIALQNTNTLYLFSPTAYQDGGINFTVRLQTDPLLYDTLRTKTMSRLIVDADQPTTAALLSVRFSDDDYQTYSTARLINLNQEYPVLHRWGSFRKRSFDFQFVENAPLRIRDVDIDINYGIR